MTIEQECWQKYARWFGAQMAVATGDEVHDWSYALDSLRRATEAYPDGQKPILGHPWPPGAPSRLISTVAYWFGSINLDDKLPGDFIRAAGDKLVSLMDEYGLQDYVDLGKERGQELQEEWTAKQEGRPTNQAMTDMSDFGDRIRKAMETAIRNTTANAIGLSGLVEGKPGGESDNKRATLANLGAAATAHAEKTKEMDSIPQNITVEWRDGKKSHIHLIGVPVDVSDLPDNDKESSPEL